MDKKAEKDVSKLANFILNNMSISEALHILAKKSQEVAEDMIKNNKNYLEYKENLLKDKEKKEEKGVTSLLDKTILWFKKLIEKKEVKVETPKETLDDNSKQIFKSKPYIRTGFATKKKK